MMGTESIQEKATMWTLSILEKNYSVGPPVS